MIVKIEFFILITILFLIGFMWYVASKANGTPLDRFTHKLTIIGSLFVPIGIFLTYRVFSLQYQSMKRDSTYKIIDRGWLGVNEKMVSHYKECPVFINSLYFDWQRNALGKTDLSSPNNDKWYAVNYISIIIFQAWEDFITSSKIDETGDVVWLNNFIQWANSPILRNNWSVLKSNYAETTQLFGDYLFYITAVYKPANESELNSLARMAATSDDYKKILSKRFSSIDV